MNNDEDGMEISPSAVYDRVTSSNPMVEAVPRATIFHWLTDAVNTLNEQLVAETDPENQERLKALIGRRELALRWLTFKRDETVDIAFSFPLPPKEARERSWEGVDQKRGFPHHVLWRIGSVIAEDTDYWNEVITCLEGQPRQREILAAAQWAEAAFDAASSLQFNAELARFGDYMDEENLLAHTNWSAMARSAFVFPFLSLKLAEENYELMRVAIFRSVDIMTFVVDNPLPSDVAAFLSRLAKLYIWGYDSECFVAGRAVLEAALKQRLDDETVTSARSQRSGQRRVPDLADRVNVAGTLGILTKSEVRDAQAIRLDGNMVIHEFPNSNLHHANALVLIGSLSRLLTKILR